MQFGECFALDTEALILGEVQVQHVHLHQLQSVKLAQHHLARHEVAADIEQESTPGKTGRVRDRYVREVPALLVALEQLVQRGERMEGTQVGGGLDADAGLTDGECVGLILPHLQVIAFPVHRHGDRGSWQAVRFEERESGAIAHADQPASFGGMQAGIVKTGPGHLDGGLHTEASFLRRVVGGPGHQWWSFLSAQRAESQDNDRQQVGSHGPKIEARNPAVPIA